ncbi:MAG: HAMP domain-containing protein [Deltaproteobacteria bacterium]|nr:HAMP domain-containing protein [Deltaproteobacteria bacterium]
MFSRPLRDLTHTVGFRLTLWYSGMFILSMSMLFGLIYLILSASLKQQDHEMIQSRLRELSTVYAQGGVEALEREVSGEKKFKKRNAFLVRVADSGNRTVFLILPYQWADFDFKVLEEKSFDGWFKLFSRTGKDVLEVASSPLAFRYTLQVGKSTEDREKVLRNFLRIFVAALIPLVLLGFVGGIFLSYRSLRPIRQLTETVRSISSGRMDARAPMLRSRDELGDLVILFNSMVEKIERLIRAMRESLDNVAHDLRTPMTRMRGIAEMALRSDGDVEASREALADCLEESDRILKMLNTLMDISEAESGTMTLELREVKVRDVMKKVMDLYGYVAEEKELHIETRCPEDLSFVVDPLRIGQALANLLDNAVKYSPWGGNVEVTAEQKGDGVLIAVKDAGIGMGPGELPRIWDRLYRADQSRSQKGLGLGLSLVKAIVEAHKGEVGVSSEPGKGSVFTLYLPLHASSDAL